MAGLGNEMKLTDDITVFRLMKISQIICYSIFFFVVEEFRWIFPRFFINLIEWNSLFLERIL